jgi:hypothetical protein
MVRDTPLIEQAAAACPVSIQHNNDDVSQKPKKYKAGCNLTNSADTGCNAKAKQPNEDQQARKKKRQQISEKCKEAGHCQALN